MPASRETRWIADLRLDRRRFLTGGAAATAFAVTHHSWSLLAQSLDEGSLVRLSATAPEVATTHAGGRTVDVAMHIHLCGSEGAVAEESLFTGSGSWEAAAAEARANHIGVVCPTEHDWRMYQMAFPGQLGFSTSESDPAGLWRLTPVDIRGSLSSKSAALCPGVASPGSTGPPSALRVSACANSCGTYAMDLAMTNWMHRAALFGQTLTVDLKATGLQPDSGFAELVIGLSNRPAFCGRPAGAYRLAIRLAPGVDERRVDYERRGLSAIVYQAIDPSVGAGEWVRVTIDPTAAVAKAWPDLIDPGDNSTVTLALGATSLHNHPVTVWWDELVFRRMDANEALAEQVNLASRYHSDDLLWITGQETSYYSRAHSNWIGGDLVVVTYPPDAARGDDPPAGFEESLDRLGHAHGALRALCHPAGVDFTVITSPSARAAKRRATASTMLTTRSLATKDLGEFAYAQRGGLTLDDHLELWDIASRQGYCLVNVGTSDNHSSEAGSWRKDPNRYITRVMVESVTAGEVLDGLATGRAVVFPIGAFDGGNLDLCLHGDGTDAHMGDVAPLRSAPTRRLTVQCVGLKPTDRLELVQGPIDAKGLSCLASGRTVTSLGAASGSPGAIVEKGVDIGSVHSTFVRAQVRNARGTLIALSEPIWVIVGAELEGQVHHRGAPLARRTVPA